MLILELLIWERSFIILKGLKLFYECREKPRLVLNTCLATEKKIVSTPTLQKAAVFSKLLKEAVRCWI